MTRALALILFSLAGCGDDDGETDAGVDAAQDAADVDAETNVDAEADADAELDAEVDVDAEIDAEIDADARTDLDASEDAIDSAEDVSPDAAPPPEVCPGDVDEDLDGTIDEGCPTNVILFIADGAGPEQMRAARMYDSADEVPFSFEGWAVHGTVRTNNVSGGVTDSAAASTAMATGTKVANRVISVSGGEELPTALEIQRDRGKRVGLVTTATPITDATPAGFGAHELDRGSSAAIAMDYLEQTRPNVLFGFTAVGLDATNAGAAGYTVVTSLAELEAVDLHATSYLSGQFTVATTPTLGQLTRAALDVLADDPDGFFLLVEHEGTDEGSHMNDLARVIRSLLEWHDAIEIAMEWADGRGDTLLIATADHETGGLTVTETTPTIGVVPEHAYATTNHTSTPVLLFARGPGAAMLEGSIENTAIFGALTQPDP